MPGDEFSGPPADPTIIEWRENGRRLREAAGDTPVDALEAEKRKRLELEAKETGFVSDPDKEKNCRSRKRSRTS